jgi:hypothetical protein
MAWCKTTPSSCDVKKDGSVHLRSTIFFTNEAWRKTFGGRCQGLRQVMAETRLTAPTRSTENGVPSLYALMILLSLCHKSTISSPDTKESYAYNRPPPAFILCPTSRFISTKEYPTFSITSRSHVRIAPKLFASSAGLTRSGALRILALTSLALAKSGKTFGV